MTEDVTRREFGRHVASLALGGAWIVSVSAREIHAHQTQTDEVSPTMEPACNFQASFMTWDVPYRKDPRPYARHNCPHGNMARIQLDALIDVIDLADGSSQRFVLIAPCRAEWVYAEDRLFQLPSREYRNIYSLTEERSMGRNITDEGGPSRGHPAGDTFQSLKIDIRTYANSRALTTAAEIVEATAANRPLVGRTEIRDPQDRHRYLLEYPVKTMNFQPKTNSFQVDTGPVLTPDFQSGENKPIDRLEMAHIAYNRLDRAEFILRRPTPIHDQDGKQLCRVLHYSEVREDSARTQILAGE